jgi:hypothetical protein
MEMDNILLPLSFTQRRAPIVGKVEADAERMYAHARYVIVLDENGLVHEARLNRRQDDCIIDCLAVFAPVQYCSMNIKKTVVLEIGLRRFVPYSGAEYRPNSSTKRGPRIRRRKTDVVQALPLKAQPVRKSPKTITIPSRIPVAKLTEDALFDLIPTITEGIQACVDGIALTWDKSLGQSIRWARGGNRRTGIFWMKHEIEPSISVRVPKKTKLLCATAAFAEMEWRKEPDHHLEKRADAIKDMLKSFLRPKRRRGKGGDGRFEDDFVLKSETCKWVSERLGKVIEHGYSPAMVEIMLDFIGPPESTARKLVEQIWRVYRIPHPKRDREFETFNSEYGDFKDLLLERWRIKNYRNLRLERIREDKYVTTEDGEKRLKQHFHATDSYIFTVFVSKEGQAKMIEAYCARKAREAEDEDIPWDTPHGGTKTGTDDDIPF